MVSIILDHEIHTMVTTCQAHKRECPIKTGNYQTQQKEKRKRKRKKKRRRRRKKKEAREDQRSRKEEETGASENNNFKRERGHLFHLPSFLSPPPSIIIIFFFFSFFFFFFFFSFLLRAHGRCQRSRIIGGRSCRDIWSANAHPRGRGKHTQKDGHL